VKLKTVGAYARYLGLLVFFLLAGVTSMHAFGILDFGKTASWKEEVLLHDGSKIIVNRWQKRGGRHEPGQEPGIAEQSLTFTLPGSKKTISWRDEYSEDVGGANFHLVALHIINTIPYIITTPAGCLAYNKWGRPDPPYVIFNHNGKEWKRINASELPKEFANVNLVIGIVNEEEELVHRGFISAKKVSEFNSTLKQPEYKTILHSPMGGMSCPDWSSPRYTSPKAPFPIAPQND